MIDIITSSTEILAEAQFTTMPISILGRAGLLFEDALVLGFLFNYSTTDDLLKHWDRDSNQAIREYQFVLRKAGQKAWNAYCVFLSPGEVDYENLAALTAVEENLEGTRKIVRSNIKTLADLLSALLPLLPLQTAPKLEAVDITEEIRIRSTELNQRILDAFFSKVDDSIVLQVLEEDL